MEANAPFFVDKEIIILTRNGVWMADGTEITHEPTRRLFARSLRKEGDGYTLYIGRETKKIQVEDTAYFVQRIDGDTEHGFELLLNDETREKLDPTTLQYQPGRLTCRIKASPQGAQGAQGSAEEAKFLHAPYFDLLKDLKADGTSYYLEFGPPTKSVRVDLAKKSK